MKNSFLFAKLFFKVLFILGQISLTHRSRSRYERKKFILETLALNFPYQVNDSVEKDLEITILELNRKLQKLRNDLSELTR